MPRRFRSRRGRPPRMRRKRPTTWINSFYEQEQATPPFQGFFAFALVEPIHYTEDYAQSNTFKQEGCTVLRSIGRLLVEPTLGSGDAAGMRFVAALIVAGEEALENIAIADQTDLFLHDANLFEENMSRLDVLQLFPFRDYSASFQDVRGFPGTGNQSYINIPNNVQLDYDVSQRRKLKTDEALWLLVTYDSISTADPASVFGVSQNRTLIAHE
jgi:hypothetical protein